MKSDAATRSTLLTRFKSRLQAGQKAIRERYLSDPDALQLLHDRSRLIDEVLCDLWHELGFPASLTLVAVGGYGRGELFPASDIDLLLLLPKPPDAALTARLEQLVSLFWDIGLEIGHSVRTVEECLDEATGDVTIQTSLLEARRLTGSERLFAKFLSGFKAHLDPQAFFHAKRMEQDERHLRYLETPYSLEPNCKESPGGLRDLQSILWIAQAAGYGKAGRTWNGTALLPTRKNSISNVAKVFCNACAHSCTFMSVAVRIACFSTIRQHSLNSLVSQPHQRAGSANS